MATTHSTMLKEVLANVAKQMAAKLGEIRAKYAQSGDKGYNVEEIFRNFLRCCIGRRLTVGHGEIIDHSNNRSGQTHIIIVNDDHPFIFTTDKPGLFFVEGGECHR